MTQEAAQGAPVDAQTAGVFAPIRSRTSYEQTLERLQTAIKLGLLGPGARLPAERELCERLGISRSTLRQALSTLVHSGHLTALRGRGGGTFVAQDPPPAAPPDELALARWREHADQLLAIELGVAVLAAERAGAEAIARLEALVAELDEHLDDQLAYRRLDVAFHVALATAAASPALTSAVTEAHGAIADVLATIDHPPAALAWANTQHSQLLDSVRRRDATAAMRVMADHHRGTEQVLATLLP